MNKDWKAEYEKLLKETDEVNLEKGEEHLAKWILVVICLLQLTVNIGSTAALLTGKLDGGMYVGIIAGTNPMTALILVIRIMVTKGNKNGGNNGG